MKLSEIEHCFEDIYYKIEDNDNLCPEEILNQLTRDIQDCEYSSIELLDYTVKCNEMDQVKITFFLEGMGKLKWRYPSHG